MARVFKFMRHKHIAGYVKAKRLKRRLDPDGVHLIMRQVEWNGAARCYVYLRLTDSDLPYEVVLDLPMKFFNDLPVYDPKAETFSDELPATQPQ